MTFKYKYKTPKEVRKAAKLAKYISYHASIKFFLLLNNITQKSCACPIIFCDVKFPLPKEIGD